MYEPPVRSSGSAFVRPAVDPSAKPASVSLSIGGGAKTVSLPKADPDAKPATVSLKIGGGGGASKGAGASSSAAGSAAGSSKAATPANSSKAATPNSSKPATPVAGKSASAAAPSAAVKKEEKVAAANAKKEEKAEAKKVEEAKKDAVEAEIQAVADAEALEDLYGGDGASPVLHPSDRTLRHCDACVDDVPCEPLTSHTDKEVKPHVNIVFIGHVDAGKSTMGGNILYLCGMVDKRTLEKYEREAKEAGRESWYLSWALDSTSQEREKVRAAAYFLFVKRAPRLALHCTWGRAP